MKVLHAAETVKGGVASVVRCLAEDQKARDYDTHFLAPADQAEELGEVAAPTTSTFLRTGRNLASAVAFLRAFVRSVRLLQPDVVHLHSSFAGLIGRVALVVLSPWCRPRVVYSPHAWAFLMDTPEWRKAVYAWIERMLLLATDAVICVSHFEKAEAESRGLPADKLRVIYNGVECSDYQARTPDLENRHTLRLLFVGRFDRQKGFDLLWQAMSRIGDKPIRLTAVGGVVHAETPPPPLPNIEYVAWVPYKQLPKHFRAADVLVMPSRWESFGLVAAEAHSHGLPVIATNCCSIPEIVVDGETGRLVRKDDIDDLLAKITESTKDRLHQMGQEGRQRYLRLFTAERMATAVSHLYEGLVHHTAPEGAARIRDRQGDRLQPGTLEASGDIQN